MFYPPTPKKKQCPENHIYFMVYKITIYNKYNDNVYVFIYRISFK